MDPATAAGLVLAVIPLIISVFKKYEATFQPFVTFRRNQRQARKFQSTLKIQQTAFRNECFLLLSAITRQQDEMLSNPKHSMWRDQDLAKQLGAYLDDSLETCLSTLDLMHGAITEIDKKTWGGFGDLLKTEEQSGKSRYTLFQEKLKLSFSKLHLEEKVNELRRHNEDFRVLSKQVKRLAKEQSTPFSPRVENKATAQYQIVRKASQKLYDTLSSIWSCPSHVEHSANICLNEDDQARSHTIPCKIRFNMTLTYFESLDSNTIGKPLWLTIDSAVEQTETPMIAPAQPEGTGIYKLNATLHTLDKKGKSVSFTLSPAANASVIHQASSSSSTLDDISLDLCSVKNMCLFIQERLQTCATSLQCIGILQNKSVFKHFIYPSQATQHSVNRGTSLDEALMAAKTSQYRIPIIDKLRLAKLLALAVLQFHSTPWLREKWRSRDVYFYSSEDLSPNSLQAPYLSARFSKDSGVAKRQCEQASSESSLSLAPNVTLFSLGVVLLELGFEAPIHALQRPEDLKDGVANEYSDYWTARRLSKTVSSTLNSTYGKLVNKCLYCDFGLGGSYELENVDLQKAFFRDVVCGLDRCLQAVLIC